MRGGIFAGAVLVVLAMVRPVTAADMSVPIITKAPPLLWAWSGCYTGLNVGYGWGRSKVTDATEVIPTGTLFSFSDFDFQNRGALGGGQFGCNWQAAAAVFGIEADFQATGFNGDVLFPNAIFNFPSAAFSTQVSSKLWYFGTVRGRMGVAVVPTAMLYVTGGWAYGAVDSVLSFPSVTGTPNAFLDSSRNTHTGFAAGAGIEVQVTPRISVKAEYLYVDLGSKSYNFAVGGAFAWNEHLTMQTFRLGVNFLWPVAAIGGR
jgi:outer membrane immunogenic protein